MTEPESAPTPAPASEPKPLSPKRRRRRILIRVLAVLLPLTIVFAIGEVFVRYRYPIVDPRPYFLPGIYRSDPDIGWELLPNYEGHYHQQVTRLETRTNAQAMRDPPLTEERKATPRRVLLLGDSIAFGRGLGEEHTIARRLEARWEQTAVFNAGVPGFDTSQELARLRRFGPMIKPQVVILEWYRNDIMVPSHQVEAKVFEGHLVNPDTTREDYERWRSRFVDHTHNPIDWSALIRLGRVQWKNFKTQRKLEERAKTPWEVDETHEGLQRSLAALREANAWCQENGAKFAVVMFPAREECEVDGPAPVYPKVLADFCAAEKIPFRDLTPLWKEHFKKTGKTLYLPRDRCHPNSVGGDTTAGWIDEAFSGLLPPL